jgi:hypothetical protein
VRSPGAGKLVDAWQRFRDTDAGLPKSSSMQMIAWVLLALWALGTAVLFAVEGSKFEMLGLF